MVKSDQVQCNLKLPSYIVNPLFFNFVLYLLFMIHNNNYDYVSHENIMIV
jgi:hypothetical protein